MSQQSDAIAAAVERLIEAKLAPIIRKVEELERQSGLMMGATQHAFTRNQLAELSRAIDAIVRKQ